MWLLLIVILKLKEYLITIITEINVGSQRVKMWQIYFSPFAVFFFNFCLRDSIFGANLN